MRTTFLGKTTILPKIDIKEQTIELDIMEEFDGAISRHHKEIVSFKETMIRNCLIQLGWTPPKSTESLPPSEAPQ